MRNEIELGAALRASRRSQGLTQDALAQRAQVSRAFVVDIEKGKRPRAELGRVLAVIQALGLGVSLVRDDEPSFDDALADLLGGDR